MKYLRKINVMIKERHFLQKDIVSSLEDIERLKEKNKTLKSKVKKLNSFIGYINKSKLFFFRKKKKIFNKHIEK